MRTMMLAAMLAAGGAQGAAAQDGASCSVEACSDVLAPMIARMEAHAEREARLRDGQASDMENMKSEVIEARQYIAEAVGLAESCVALAEAGSSLTTQCTKDLHEQLWVAMMELGQR